jgi:hypothetical protein
MVRKQAQSEMPEYLGREPVSEMAGGRPFQAGALKSPGQFGVE